MRLQGQGKLIGTKNWQINSEKRIPQFSVNIEEKSWWMVSQIFVSRIIWNDWRKFTFVWWQSLSLLRAEISKQNPRFADNKRYPLKYLQLRGKQIWLLTENNKRKNTPKLENLTSSTKMLFDHSYRQTIPYAIADYHWNLRIYLYQPVHAKTHLHLKTSFLVVNFAALVNIDYLSLLNWLLISLV